MKKFRLRPSTAFVPVSGNTFDFFQSNTRRSFRYRIASDLAELICSLDGYRPIDGESERITSFIEAMHERCFVEKVELSEIYNASPWRRIINFLGDFFPSDQVIPSFSRIQDTSIIIIGLGAVGSWVVAQLSKSGFRSFVLIDNDLVVASNLSRSLFTNADIGSLKIDAVERQIKTIAPAAHVNKRAQVITSANDLEGIIADTCGQNIVINCADHPSVDETSSWVDTACQKSLTPYIIAGGYNLHLSLIGMTVIPDESACYRCSRITLDEMQAGELAGLKRLDRPWRNVPVHLPELIKRRLGPGCG
jgi:molybdopterin/thiamine biosynthesis adenylyltransferase